MLRDEKRSSLTQGALYVEGSRLIEGPVTGPKSPGVRYSLVSKFGSYLARSSVPIVGLVDLDDLLFIVRAGGTVGAATAKGDALASGGTWGVAWRRGVEDKTAFHGGGGAPEEKEQARLEGRGKGYRGGERNNCSVIIGASCFILMRPRPYWADGRLPLTRLTAL